MDELSILQLQIAILEGKLEDAHAEMALLNNALSQTLDIVNTNIQSIAVLSRLVEQQVTARMHWTN